MQSVDAEVYKMGAVVVATTRSTLYDIWSSHHKVQQQQLERTKSGFSLILHSCFMMQEWSTRIVEYSTKLSSSPSYNHVVQPLTMDLARIVGGRELTCVWATGWYKPTKGSLSNSIK